MKVLSKVSSEMLTKQSLSAASPVFEGFTNLCDQRRRGVLDETALRAKLNRELRRLGGESFLRGQLFSPMESEAVLKLLDEKHTSIFPVIQFLSQRVVATRSVTTAPSMSLTSLSLGSDGLLRGNLSIALPTSRTLLHITVKHEGQFVTVKRGFSEFSDPQEAVIVEALGGDPRFVLLQPLPQRSILDSVEFFIPLAGLSLPDEAEGFEIEFSLIDDQSRKVMSILQESVGGYEIVPSNAQIMVPHRRQIWGVDPVSASQVRMSTQRAGDDITCSAILELREQQFQPLEITISVSHDEAKGVFGGMMSFTKLLVPTEPLSLIELDASFPEVFSVVETDVSVLVTVQNQAGAILMGTQGVVLG